MKFNLPQLPADKANHVLYGCALAFAGALVAQAIGSDPRTGAAVAAAGIGVAKELVDPFLFGGHRDVLDAIATAAGAAPVIAGYSLAAGWA